MRWFATRCLPVALIIAGLVALGVTWLSGPPSVGTVAEPPSDRAAAHAPRVTEPSPEQARGRPSSTADRLQGPHLSGSPPVALRIPRIGVSAPLGRLGLAADGTMTVPAAAEDVGWFTGSVTPGAVGPAVLAGHVTWNGSAGVFFELGTLRPHDRVLVRRQDDRTAVFTVTEVRRFPKTQFPTRSVYGPADHAALRLITCGGQFDTETRHYVDNVVVFARLIAVREGGSES